LLLLRLILNNHLMHLVKRYLLRHIFLILGFLLSINPGYNQITIYSNGSGGGDWSDTLTWSGYIIPGISDTAVVVSGDTITVDSANADIG